MKRIAVICREKSVNIFECWNTALKTIISNAIMTVDFKLDRTEFLTIGAQTLFRTSYAK